jgi:hypothetical protein
VKPSTPQEIDRANWPRPSCRICGLPRSRKTLFDGLCKWCYAEEPYHFHLSKKEPLWKSQLPSPPVPRSAEKK